MKSLGSAFGASYLGASFLGAAFFGAGWALVSSIGAALGASFGAGALPSSAFFMAAHGFSSYFLAFLGAGFSASFLAVAGLSFPGLTISPSVAAAVFILPTFFPEGAVITLTLLGSDAGNLGLKSATGSGFLYYLFLSVLTFSNSSSLELSKFSTYLACSPPLFFFSCIKIGCLFL